MDVTEATPPSLEWPDYIVVGAVLSVSASIGIYYRFSGGRQKTAAEYFSANNSMSIPLLAIALMVALLSAIAMLGISAENYISGAQFNVLNVGMILGTPIAAFLYLPVFFKLQYMSVYEYLERRFGMVARLAASIANYVQLSLYTGVVLWAPSLALEATTGLSSTMSVLLIGLICTFYSSIGGIKAVLATDIFQGFLMFGTIFVVIGIGLSDIEGGISTVWRIADEDGRLNFFNFDPDPTIRHTWWSLTLGGVGLFLLNFGVNQVHVQRLLSAKSLRSAQIALFVNTPLVILMVSATSFAGLVLYVWFKGCDPVASGQVSSYDQVMPHFAKMRLSKTPGLTGFFIAGIFSAALSTVSAMLNSLAAIAIADYIKPIYRKFDREFPDSKAPLFGKILGVVNGFTCVGIAFLTSKLGGLMQTALAISGTIGGPVLGLFTLGIFVEGANETGSVIGSVLSLILSAWITFGQPKPPVINLPVYVGECPNSTYFATVAHKELLSSGIIGESEYFYLYRISYMLYTPFGVLTTMVFGYIASTIVRCLSKSTIAEPDPDLFTPILAARIKRRREVNAKTTVPEETTISLQWPDYLIVGIVLLISASIGIYYRFSGGRQKTSEEYFSANHSTKVSMISFTMTVTFLSAIAILGISGENYSQGIPYNFLVVGFLLATPVAAFLYIPVFYGLQNMSVYEYLEQRFGGTARLVASVANLVEMCLLTGVVLYAPSLALEATTGFSSTMSILLIGLICTFYSSIGGIKAVLASDVFQGFIMIASVFCVIGVGCYDLEDGIAEVFDVASKGGRLELPSFHANPTTRHTWWSLAIGGMGFFLTDFAVGQLQVQRLLSAKSLKSAQLACFINTPMVVILSLANGFAGLVLYAWFQGCDPVASGHILSFDQVMPYFAAKRLSKIPGLAGFFIAGIFSAAFSTISAMLNSMSAIVIADYIKPIYHKFGREFPDSNAPLFGKTVCVVNGLLCMAVGLLASRMGSLIQSIFAIRGSLGGPMLGLFSLGIFVESANEQGSVIGTLLSFGLTAWMSFGQPKPPLIELPVSIDKCPNSTHDTIASYQEVVAAKKADDYDYLYPYRVSNMWYIPFGMISAMLFGSIASAVVRRFSTNPIVEINPDLLTPILAARVRRRRENISQITTR